MSLLYEPIMDWFLLKTQRWFKTCEWFSLCFFVVLLTLMLQTALGKLGICPFKTVCTDPIYWNTFGLHPTVYAYLTHKQLCLREHSTRRPLHTLHNCVCIWLFKRNKTWKRIRNSMLSEQGAVCLHASGVCLNTKLLLLINVQVQTDSECKK